jgi:hypothetical protein
MLTVVHYESLPALWYNTRRYFSFRLIQQWYALRLCTHGRPRNPDASLALAIKIRI